ncbi:PREDICTED: metal tolerance protein 11-like [Amphimedon queenslandica]|uniref:Uncharacterized protein n=1 Tax=Amphimedon queenslandica TaxID=400682 RepID=A0A1X7UB82_AMPQE|nr:PREDICTED: metal tolerance protein 11-like [Amphimedon queenslandica]|eukprot:XP_003388482.1 PREDICTED: metal tolerance protein 11-like [Amphimedon queenslandica]
MEVESQVESQVESSSEFAGDKLREELERHELESADGELEATKPKEHSNIDMNQFPPVSIEEAPNKITRSEAKWNSVILPYLADSNEDREQEREGKNKKLSFLFRRQSVAESREVRKYYKRLRKDQVVLKEAMELKIEKEEKKGAESKPLHYETALDNVVKSTADGRSNDEITKEETRKGKLMSLFQLSVSSASRLTLSVNILLFFIKLAASIQSGSLSVVSSLIDSALDLFSGVTIGITSYLMHNYNQYQYPVGRNRLEPVAIIITAAVMGTAALQIVTTSITDIINNSINPNINEFSGSIIALTILLKGGLFLLCYRVDSPSVKALATDHRNDFASNIAALVFGVLGTYVWKYLDPIGAILLSFYIIINWILVGKEQMVNLTGYRADRRFTSKLIYIALQHSKEIQEVDTVTAYTFGVRYLVEMHIVLSRDMRLEEAHDIGETLQLKLESLKEVERAFVHLDFETGHAPSSEHILAGPNY